MSAPQDEVAGLGRRRVTVPDLITFGSPAAAGLPLLTAVLGRITRHYGTGPLDPSEGRAPSRVCSADASTRPAVCR
ncbi:MULTISPECIES: hypothetical protein [unclassified Streptomyces]|uniref:hypothetical protein n=1 Tax=unclassified Streptomyces TaxID=2593676 RepID=UPI00382A1465